MDAYEDMIAAIADDDEGVTPEPPLVHYPGWPEGVIARYRTVGKATVDVRETGVRDGEARYASTLAECQGCPKWQAWPWETAHYILPHQSHRLGVCDAAALSEERARAWAQAHAEYCRALPRPEAGGR